MNKSLRTLIHVLICAFAISLTATTSCQTSPPCAKVHWPLSKDWFMNFKKEYPDVFRTFVAFDYGHSILYQTLYLYAFSDAKDIPDLDTAVFNQVIERLVSAETETPFFWPHPLRLPVDERNYAPDYWFIACEAMNMFDWAHILHARSYDIISDSRMDFTKKKEALAVNEMNDYYRWNPRRTFTESCKDMDYLMNNQYFSKTFRTKHPRFNKLIWAYHWLQLAVYEPLFLTDKNAQRLGVIKTMHRFIRTLSDIAIPGPNTPEIEERRLAFMRKFPLAKNTPAAELGPELTIDLRMMPMSYDASPQFRHHFPGIAAIFDNLHTMHDVISDILVYDFSNVRPKNTTEWQYKERMIKQAIDDFHSPDKHIIECKGHDHHP